MRFFSPAFAVSLSVPFVAVVACTSYSNLDPAGNGDPKMAEEPAVPTPTPSATTDAAGPVIDPPEGADAGAPDAASEDAASEPFPGCVGLTLDGAPDVITTELRQAAPMPRGNGPIPDGKYVLTSAITYLGPNAQASPNSLPYRYAMQVSNHGTAIRTVSSYAPSDISASTATYSAGFMTTTTVCPTAGRPFDIYFSVDGSEVTFIAGLLGDRSLVSTYRRQ